MHSRLAGTGSSPSNRSSAMKSPYVVENTNPSLDLKVNPPTTTNGTSSTGTRTSTPRKPSAYSIVRHHHQVYSLGCFCLELANIPFGHFRSIVLVSGDLNANDLAAWIHFLRGCKDSLQELELAGFRTLPEVHFWETLMVLPRPRELQIQHGYIVECDQAKAF